MTNTNMRFQYKEVRGLLLERELNELGNEGWELISLNVLEGGSQYEYVYIFIKRFRV